MLQIKQKNAGSRPEWLVENRYTFGTGVENNYKVSGTDVKAVQAGLEVNGDTVVLFNLAGGNSVKLNGEVVEKRASVQPGDIFSVGDAEYLIDDPKLKRASAAPAPSAEPQGWMLKAKNTALANKTFALEDSQVIGRANDCDICLNVVHLSRNHARITVRGGELELEDLNSSNGTYVNGVKIQTASVKAGDEITFDTLKFTVFGPKSEFERTQQRSAYDGDATTLRPAISASDLAKLNPSKGESQKQKNATKKSSAEQTKPATQTESAAASDSPEDGKSGIAMISVIVIAIIALVAYLVFA